MLFVPLTTVTPFSALNAIMFPAPSCDSASYQVARGAALNFDAIVGTITAVQRTAGVGTDVVALYDVVVRTDLDPFYVV